MEQPNVFTILGLFFLLNSATLGGLGSESRPRGHHPWLKPLGKRTITVDCQGFGDFLTVQAAIDSIPEGNTENVTIQIGAGYYVEKVVVPASKAFITLQGAGRDVTVIEWHNRASDLGPTGQQLRTYNTASVTVFSNHFTARNMSFKNTAPAPMPGMEGWQAAAFRISGDKALFVGCGFYGAQDTLCDDAGRHYLKDCYIEGSIDFIFGNGRSMYKDCEIHSIATKFGSIAAQARQSPLEKTGFAFVNCKVTGTGPLYVGRALGQYSRVVFAYTYFDDIVSNEGWDDWDHRSNQRKEAFFGVYRCWGPGAGSARGVSWARELDFMSAKPFLVKSFVNGRHWISPSDV
ncbi:probable pectinesterase 68 [Amborella trichopoda]|uniref:probable pectinesterase 68 n=1 Tax=Amborella trichopoda TaxID=13333 RepID=UPI0005D31876|nr:probable pectinesterase 68 [Amborella trichopoda]|eukprot:XP_011621394.1 probable pectinesterase 68 [Amborella trichopoda]